jgi:hypothetical protein
MKLEDTQPVVENQYSLQGLFIDSAFIKTAKGHILLDGSKYRVKEANHDIVNDEGFDNLILYPGGDKSKGYTIGTRPENTEEFKLIDLFKPQESAKLTVEELRAQEQQEILSKIPNIENFKVDGKIDKTLMTGSVLETYNEIYDRYDKLITPLLQSETKTPVEGQLSLFEPLTAEEQEELEKIINHCKPKK